MLRWCARQVPIFSLSNIASYASLVCQFARLPAPISSPSRSQQPPVGPGTFTYTTASLLIIVAFTKWIYWMVITTLSDKHIRFWNWYHGEGRGRRMSAPTGSYRYCSKCISLHTSSLVSNFHGCRKRKPFDMISWLTTLTILRQFTPITTPNVLRNAPSALLMTFVRRPNTVNRTRQYIHSGR